MARIVYALSGQGRGHTSRVLAMSAELRSRGHEIVFCCGGTAREILNEQGEAVIEVPALRQVVHENKLQIVSTLWQNAGSVCGQRSIVGDLADQFRDFGPDLLITDFEAFSPKAARKLGVPTLSFNHQEIVTRTVYELPDRYRAHAFLTGLVIKLVAPKHPVHSLLTSFYFPPVKDPQTTTLVRPIIRREVMALQPSVGDHVLVYFNQTMGAEFVLEALRGAEANFVVYNFAAPSDPTSYPNITFKSASLDGFLSDLATCRAVICTAGFTLMSEALFLGKPTLVVPNEGIFEQTLNALFLCSEGLGQGVFGRELTSDDVHGFLNRLTSFSERIRNRSGSGNIDAADCIERVLRDHGAFVAQIPRRAYSRENGEAVLDHS
ncbi:MAG: glycosyl transferase [Bacteroidetes bacterium]|nr:glycosyl transferase [Bacteroidota bacterium]